MASTSYYAQENGSLETMNWVSLQQQKSAKIRRLKTPDNETTFHIIITGTGYLLVIAIFLLPSIFILSVIYPLCYVFRYITSIISLYFNHKNLAFNSFLSPTELFLLHQKPGGNVCLMQLKRPVDEMTVKNLIRERIINSDESILRRFKEIAFPLWTGYVWIQSEDFDLNNHIHVVHQDRSPIKEQSMMLVEKLLSQELDKSHPLWQMYILSDSLFFHYHVCMYDGVSMLQIFNEYFSDEQNSILVNGKQHCGNSSFTLSAVRAFFIAPFLIIRIIFSRKDKPLGKMDTENLHRRFEVTEISTLPTKMVERLRMITRTSVNDIFLCCISGAINNHFRSSGVTFPPNVHITQPVDLRTDEKIHDPGMDMTFVRFKLPSSGEGMVPRLWRVKLITDDFKTSTDLAFHSVIMNVAAVILPLSLSLQLFDKISSLSTCQFSNINGPLLPLTFANQPIRSMYFWMAPLNKMHISLNLLSYGDSFYFTSCIDSSFISDVNFQSHTVIDQLLAMKELINSRNIPLASLRKIQTLLTEKIETLNQLKEQQSKESTPANKLTPL